MFRFDARCGYYLYPEAEGQADITLFMNKGTTFDGDVDQRADICVVKHGLKIPASTKNYSDFAEKMEENASRFAEVFKKTAQGEFFPAP